MNPLLEKEIQWYITRGYRIVHQTDVAIQLVRPKQFSFLAAVLWTLFFGIGLIFYLFYYMAQKDTVVYLRLVDGKVVTTYS